VIYPLNKQLGYTKKRVCDKLEVTEVSKLPAKLKNAITCGLPLLPNYLYMFSWLKPERLKYLSQMLNNIWVFHVQVGIWNVHNKQP